ncbi:MAG TPA: hypothetical protein DDW65_19565 [Firmicutes bacterium]|nr:hypothetical protein [Bacillota bacterium]
MGQSGIGMMPKSRLKIDLLIIMSYQDLLPFEFLWIRVRKKYRFKTYIIIIEPFSLNVWETGFLVEISLAYVLHVLLARYLKGINPKMFSSRSKNALDWY